MGVITFHSLEDRIVKNFFRNLGKECVCPPEFAECRCGGKQCAEILTRKPVCPGEEEIKVNSPSRSAKLRVVRKLKNAEKLQKISALNIQLLKVVQLQERYLFISMMCSNFQ